LIKRSLIEVSFCGINFICRKLRPLGVPMKRAEPRRSDSDGLRTSYQASGLMSANSSRTTKSSERPRKLSGFSAPLSDMTDPFHRVTVSDDSLVFCMYSLGTVARSMSQAISLAALYVGATYQQCRLPSLSALVTNSTVDRNVLPNRRPATTTRKRSSLW